MVSGMSSPRKPASTIGRTGTPSAGSEGSDADALGYDHSKIL
jgi:hypothetical protein